MLVLNGDRHSIPSTEKSVLGWMRTWNGQRKIGGIAISGCFVPDRRPGRTRDATEIDLLVLTPQACVVIEVKGLTTAVGGELSCPANGPWSQTGVTGSPVHLRQNDTNPLDQLRASIFNIKNLTRQINLDVFISGMVLVMPALGPRPTLIKNDLPVGIDVMLGSEPALRQWFLANARHNPIWSAEQARSLLEALNFADAAPIPALIDQGFPSETQLRSEPEGSAQPQQYPHPELEAPDAPRPRISFGSTGAERFTASSESATGQPVTAAEPRTPDPFTPQPTAPITQPDAWPPPRRRHGWQPARLLVAATLWLGLAAGAGAVLSPDHAPASGPPTISSKTAVPEPPPPAEPKASQPRPSRWTPPPCYPLQSAC